MSHYQHNLKIINIMAASVDGKIAAHFKESSEERNVSGHVCKADFDRLRMLVATCDAVFLGARSLLAEKAAFKVVNKTSATKEPEWIIFTRSGQVSFSHDFWRQKEIPKSLFIISSFDMSEKPMLRVENQQHEFGELVCYLGNVCGLMQYLSQKGYKKIALLGGGELNAPFWENNLVDELFLTMSPIVIGNKNSPSLISSQTLLQKKLECKKVTKEGNFIFIDYKVKK